MKKVFFILTMITSMAFMPLNGINEKIASAIKVGNSKELAKYFATNVELTIGSKQGSYSKAQAELIVKDFFAKNPAEDYKVMHQGKSKDGSQYTIGDYFSSTGTFRTYYLIKKNGNKQSIQQLRFEPKPDGN